MIEIKVSKKQSSIELDGTRVELGWEIANIIKSLLKENKEFGKDVIFGLAQICSKEEINEMLEKYYESEEMADTFMNADSEKKAKMLVELLGKLFGEKKDE